MHFNFSAALPHCQDVQKWLLKCASKKVWFLQREPLWSLKNKSNSPNWSLNRNLNFSEKSHPTWLDFILAFSPRMPSPALQRMTGCLATWLQLLLHPGELSHFPLTGTKAKSQDGTEQRHTLYQLPPFWKAQMQAAIMLISYIRHMQLQPWEVSHSSPPGPKKGPEEVARDNDQAIIRRGNDIKDTPQRNLHHFYANALVKVEINCVRKSQNLGPKLETMVSWCP